MTRLDLFLLGPPYVKCAGKPIQVDRNKAIALLAYLALPGPGAGGEHHTRDALAALFWPESSQARARAALRKALWVLNKALGEGWFAAGREHLALRRNAHFWLDVDHFYDRLAECHTHGHPQDDVCPACLGPLAEAVTLYRDDFLSGFTLRDSPGFDEWQRFQGERLRCELGDALERLVRGHCDQGAHQQALAYTQRWLALDPLHEPAHRYLMRLYAQTGQRAAALDQYRRCEQVLERELGLSPQQETTQLYQAIQKDGWLQPNDPAAPISFVRSRPHNLFLQPTPFMGREDALAEIERLLKDPTCRLLTLVGAGGVGKTRLALQAALQAATEKSVAFSHGVYVVPLASLNATGLLAPTIADAIAFSLRDDEVPKEQLFGYLREKEMLLVLDNFEHLLAGAGLLAELLSNVPGVKLLVTSRERLNLRWEWPFEVRGLKFPPNSEAVAPEDYSAVQLFLWSANRVHPALRLTEAQKPFAIRICQSLQGIPLGIELAAAWVETLSCQEIAQELERNLGFLATSMRDVPERHRSLRAAFDHSWRFLSEEEKSVFARLSVFRGGFRREAAGQVAGASLSLLSALMHKSLLRSNAAGRYEMLEVLRQYAQEKLAISQQSDSVHDRHCEYHAVFLHQREARLSGKEQKETLEEIGAEIDNVRAGWQWAVTRGKTAQIDISLASLYRFYDTQSWFSEGAEAFGKAAERLKGEMDAPEQSLLLGKLLARQGRFCERLSRFAEARELLQTSLSIFRRFGASKEMAFALDKLGDVAWALNEYAQARQWYQESLALYQELGDQQGIAACSTHLSLAAERLGEYRTAKQLHRESLAIYRRLGDRRGLANCLSDLGVVTWRLGEYAEAKRSLEQSLPIFQALNDEFGIAKCLNLLGLVAQAQGEYSQARQLYRKSLTFYKEIGDRRGIASSLNNLGLAFTRLGEYAEAKQAFQESLTTCEELGDRRGVAVRLVNLGLVANMQEEYQEAKRLYQQGLAVYKELDDRRNVVITLGNLGVVAEKLGQHAEAARLHRQSLMISKETGDRYGIASGLNNLGFALCALAEYCEAKECFREALKIATDTQAASVTLEALMGVAMLLEKEEEKERALEIVSYVIHHPALHREIQSRAEQLLSELKPQFTPQTLAAVQARGKERQLEYFKRLFPYGNQVGRAPGATTSRCIPLVTSNSQISG